MGDTLAQADRAFVEEDFQQAVDLYSKALQEAPNNARIYDSRAGAYIKLGKHLEAVEDASKAVQLEPSMAKAYLKKGMATFMLEEYEAAKECFEAGAKLAPDNTQFPTWIRKCDAELEEELGGQGNTVSKAQGAALSSPTSVLPAAQQPAPAPPTPAQAAAAPPSEAAAEAPLAPAAPATHEGKYRHQFYQMGSRVSVDVFAKNKAKEQVSVEFSEQRLVVTLRDPATGEEEYKMDVELYGKVVPGQSRYEVLRSKVEITMVKQINQHWPTLERSNQVAASNISNPDAPPVTGQYPSSYVKKKDWSKVEAEVKELESKGELADGDPLNDFFKKIFKDGDEDQRRAMMKSFVESNGTVLSTNWKEVGAKKVECSPPDGMKVNKWEM